MIKKFSYPQREWNLAVTWKEVKTLTGSLLRKYSLEIADNIQAVPYDWAPFGQKRVYTVYFGFDTESEAKLVENRVDREMFSTLVFRLAIPKV
jgi:hypothetical protein